MAHTEPEQHTRNHIFQVSIDCADWEQINRKDSCWQSDFLLLYVWTRSLNLISGCKCKWIFSAASPSSCTLDTDTYTDTWDSPGTALALTISTSLSLPTPLITSTTLEKHGGFNLTRSWTESTLLWGPSQIWSNLIPPKGDTNSHRHKPIITHSTGIHNVSVVSIKFYQNNARTSTCR